MNINKLETRMTDRFFLTLKEQGTKSLNPQSGRPVLYLKCWGSDYPYLGGSDPQERCLPALVDSAAEHWIRRSSMLFVPK